MKKKDMEKVLKALLGDDALRDIQLEQMATAPHSTLGLKPQEVSTFTGSAAFLEGSYELKDNGTFKRKFLRNKAERAAFRRTLLQRTLPKDPKDPKEPAAKEGKK